MIDINKLAFALILLASTCACRSGPAVAGRAAASPTPATQVPNDFVLSLQRGECLGDCPVYTVTVDASGQVEYEGTRFVTVNGPAHWKVSPEIVLHLYRLLERLQFRDLEFKCHESWSDVPTQTISFAAEGRESILSNRWGSGTEFSFLVEAEDKLDPNLELHALLGWLAYWIDFALDTARCVHGDKSRGSG